MEQPEIHWTEYMLDRIQLRGFDLEAVEQIVRYSNERYFDTDTGRSVVVGRHGSFLVMIPFEREGQALVPVTIHITSRQQIRQRLGSGRLVYE